VLIIAFDIAARGKSASKHGIVAVGIVAGLEDGTIVFEKGVASITNARAIVRAALFV
jgi:hypothetical protein